MGTAAIREALAGFVAAKPTIRTSGRLVAQTGDIALLANDWTLALTGPDGKPATMTGHAVESRAAPGRTDDWLFVMDMPFGTPAPTRMTADVRQRAPRLDRHRPHGLRDGGAPREGRRRPHRLESHAREGRAARGARREDRRALADLAACDIVFVMVSTWDDVKEVVAGPGGLLSRPQRRAEAGRRMLVDLARRLGRAARDCSPRAASSCWRRRCPATRR